MSPSVINCSVRKLEFPWVLTALHIPCQSILYSYEYEWIEKQRVAKNYPAINAFKNCCRYIDDLLIANNDDLMKSVISDIYPKELILVPDESDGLAAPFLDLQLVVKNGVVSTSIFDKRDAFDFQIINFPTLTGNIPIKSSYGLFICEAVRFMDGSVRERFVFDRFGSVRFMDQRVSIRFDFPAAVCCSSLFFKAVHCGSLRFAAVHQITHNRTSRLLFTSMKPMCL